MRVHFSHHLAGLAAGAVLALTSVSTAGAVSPGPVAGGPAGLGTCAAQVRPARSSATIADLRAFGDCEIERRFTTLGSLASAVTGSKVLTAADANALQAEIDATRSGLTNLKGTIDAESSKTSLLVDIRRIATDYRVYVLEVPQAHLVNAAERVLAAESVFGKVSAALTSRIVTAKAAGKDVTAAQGHLDAMQAAVAKAQGLAAPLPGRLLPLTPAAYKAGTAGPVLADARGTLLQARALLLSARQDAKLCRDALVALR